MTERDVRVACEPMSRQIKDSIRIFHAYFYGRIGRLRGMQLHESDRLYKKLIAVSIIDALAVAGDCPASTHRGQFTNVISDYGDWPNERRVSAPHLLMLLDRVRDARFAPARELAERVSAENAGGTLVPLEKDPDVVDVLKVWPVGPDDKVYKKVTLRWCTHLHLLYSYRNALTHELREPGYGMEFGNERSEPYYNTMGTAENPDVRTLELVYPLGFYIRLAENVLENIRGHLLVHGIDPFSLYTFGSSWIRELNSED